MIVASQHYAPATHRLAAQLNATQRFLYPFSSPRFASRGNASHCNAPRLGVPQRNVSIPMTARPVSQLSVEVAALAEYWQEREEITYAQMSELLGRDVNGGDPVVQGALKQLFRRHGLCFTNIRGHGYRRHTDGTLLGEATWNRHRLRRMARRSGQRLTKVQNFEMLTDQEKLQHQSHLALFGAVSVMASKKGITAIERVATTSNEKLPLGKTLEAFR